MIEKTLPDGTKVNCYPMTSAQQLMFYLALAYGTDSPVLNIGSGHYWQGEIDEQLMREAIDEAVARCDTMRLHFIPDEKYKLLQYVSPVSDIEVTTLDFSDKTEDEAFNYFKAYTKRIVPMFNGPIHTINIVHLPDNYHGIYIKLHHLAMDGYSAKVFISDIMELYLNKKCGMPYPKPMKSYEQALAKEFAYLTSEQHKADQYFWTHSMDAEPIYTDYMRKSRLKEQREATGNPNLRAASVHDDHPQAATVVFPLDAETSQRITDFCQEHEYSLPCLLMLGLRCALSSFNDREEDVSFKLMINRRGSLLEKKSGGMRMHFFSMRTIVSPDKTFDEAVRIVENAQSEIFAHSNLSSLEMIQLRHMAVPDIKADDTYESMSFSYHPFMQVPAENEQMRRTCKGIWYNNDFSIQNLYLTVMHRSNDGGLDFIFEYRTNNNPLEDVTILNDKLRRSILIGMENPEMTIGEVLDKISD